MPTLRASLAAAAALAGAASLCACGPQPPRARNAILITLDTTRIDALGCYGGAPEVTPNLDQLARESLVFDAARSVTPLTLPAHASMLTGLIPPRHGVHDNGIALLPPAAVTLAERARDGGLQTAAFVAASVLDRTFGLDQGFEHWDQPEAAGSEPTSGPGERSAQQVVAAAQRWLARRDRARPFFVWLHFYDPHVPYAPPSAFARQAGGNPYLGEVASMDAALGDFLAPLRADGTLDSTLLVVVADHGESLGEHDEPTHGAFCYDVTMRVPLLVRLPDGRGAGRRTSDPASVVDVFPTVLEALRLGPPGDVDALSLLGALEGARPRGQYLESYSGWLNYGWSPLAGWVEDEVKYLHSSAPELYRLEPDPGERDDVHDPASEAARRGVRALADAWARPRLAVAEVEPDPALLDDLRRLGYGATGGPRDDLPAPLEPSDLPAPRERAGELWPLWQANALAAGGAHEQVVALLRPLVAENPRNGLALDLCGISLMELGAFAEAADLWRRRLAVGPERADAWLNLGQCQERLGRVDDGLASLRRALSVDPAHPAVQSELAAMLERAGRAGEAAEVPDGRR